MNKSWQITIRVIVFSALLGGASGVLTSALTNNYLSDYTYQLGELTEPLRVTQERPRALPTSYESALELMESTALPAIGASYGSGGVVPVDQFESSVIVLTSDGWMLGLGSLSVEDTVRIGSEECIISDVVYDRRSGFSFAHCDAQNLPVVDFGDGYNLEPGDQVFVAHGGEMTFTRVKTVTYGEDALRSSDDPARRIVLEATLFNDGSAVFNIFGELVGLVNDSRVIPLEHISGSLKQVLSAVELPVYPSLSVNTVDLSRTVGVDSSIKIGALLSGWQPIGAGTEAGLEKGDVILSIDGELVGSTYTLDDLLARKVAGEVISIEFSRDDVSMNVEVTLGSVNQ